MLQAVWVEDRGVASRCSRRVLRKSLPRWGGVTRLMVLADHCLLASLQHTCFLSPIECKWVAPQRDSHLGKKGGVAKTRGIAAIGFAASPWLLGNESVGMSHQCLPKAATLKPEDDCPKAEGSTPPNGHATRHGAYAPSCASRRPTVASRYMDGRTQMEHSRYACRRPTVAHR